MFKPASVFIGLRYVRARRRNLFISFISLTSILGLALGVTALITVLSVMNGFEHELRDRILGVISHAETRGILVDVSNSELSYGVFEEWERIKAAIDAEGYVESSAPFIETKAALVHRGDLIPILIEGVLPEYEAGVSFVAEHMADGSFEALQPGSRNIVLGKLLAEQIGARIGDRIILQTLILSTPAGMISPARQFTVAGIFEVGAYEYDSSFGYVHLEDAARQFRIDGGVSGIRIKFGDSAMAPVLAQQLGWKLQNLSGELAQSNLYRLEVIPWTERHRNYFTALETEKRVMFVILALIVAVAAFNIVSMLVMVVTDKRAEVAILRTVGMHRRGIMGIFIVQGVVIGLFGTLLGVAGGVWLATNVDWIVPGIEQAMGVEFMPCDIYYICDFPSRLNLQDVWRISGLAFVLTLLATLYPAWHAARTEPAEALRYE